MSFENQKYFWIIRGAALLGILASLSILDFLYWASSSPSSFDPLWFCINLLAFFLVVIFVCLLCFFTLMVFNSPIFQWRTLIIWLLLPLSIVVNHSFLDPVIKPIAERVHFNKMRNTYINEITKLPNNGERLGIFFLSGWGELGNNTTVFVIYDESDEVKLAKPSSAWGSKEAVLSPDGVHFYMGTPLEIEPLWIKDGNSKGKMERFYAHGIISLGDHFYLIESYTY